MFIMAFGQAYGQSQADTFAIDTAQVKPKYTYRIDSTSQWGMEPKPRPANQPLHYTSFVVGLAQPMGGFADAGLLSNKQGAATTGWFFGIDNQFLVNPWLGVRFFTRASFYGRNANDLSNALETKLGTDTMPNQWQAQSQTGRFLMLQAMGGPSVTFPINHQKATYITFYGMFGLQGVVVPAWQATAQAGGITYRIEVDATAKSGFGYTVGAEFSKKLTKRLNLNAQVQYFSGAISDAFTFSKETDLAQNGYPMVNKFDTRDLSLAGLHLGFSLGYRF